MNHLHHECELECHIVEQLAARGWQVGDPARCDKARALYPDDVMSLSQTSQPQAWAKLTSLNGAGVETTVLDRLAKALEAKDGGTVVVIRDGFQIAGAGTLKMSEGLPEDDRNETTRQRYACNLLRVVPQLRYSLDNENAIDLVFFINGIPVATVELKTDFTQSVWAAVRQYKQDRNPRRKVGGRSGKTNTIAWMAHSLIRVRRPDGEPYFHSVIVVTDRQVLDKQLQDAITQIEHQSGVVKAVDRETSNLSKSQQLAQAMLAGTPIIVCTLQTFPYAQEAILSEQSLRDRRFAVIIDEAHSSTGGSTADDLRYVLTGQSEDERDRLTAQEKLSVWQSSRQRPDNASYFAFSATPKHSTLMLFGRPRNPALPVSKDNPPVPFHLYTMQQANQANQDKQTGLLVADDLPKDHQFNEANMNPGLRGRDMRKAFDSADYRVMIVANKFQAGFDQPKLVAMYVDKKISGVEAVQTLSRLNRTYPGKDKTFVIDFVNKAEEILAAFKRYCRDAQVSDVQDANVVYDLKQSLDAAHIYESQEVQAFADAIVSKNVTHEKLYTITQPATDRYNQRLHGIGADQVDLAGLMLTHYRLRKDGALVGVTGEPAAPHYLDPITENGLRDPKDAHKAYLWPSWWKSSTTPSAATSAKPTRWRWRFMCRRSCAATRW